MSRKNFLITIAIVILILLVALFGFFYYVNKRSGGNETITQTISNFLPFGNQNNGAGFQNNGGNNGQGGNGSNSTTTVTVPNGNTYVILPKLRQITTTPTAGSVIIERDRDVIVDRIKKTIREFYIRYMDRGTGHIGETKTTSLDTIEVSNATIPESYQTIFSDDGNSFLARFLAADNNTIKTYSGVLRPALTTTSATATTTATSTIAVATTTAETTSTFKNITGLYLPTDIKEFAFSPSQTKLLSSYYDIANDGGALVLSDRNGAKAKTVLSSPLRDWLVYFPTETKALIATKPSGIATGDSFILDVTTGALSKLIGGITGLTVLPSRDFTYTLIGTGGQTISLSVIRTADKNQTGQGLGTLPEKCVWSKADLAVFYCAVPEALAGGMTYPDAWYQGLVSFDDSIWKLNIKTGQTTEIAIPEKLANVSVDAINLDVSNDDSYLTFINKKDLTLWGLTLSSPTTTTTSSTATTTPSR